MKELRNRPRKKPIIIKKITESGIQTKYTRIICKAAKTIKGQLIQKCVRNLNEVRKDNTNNDKIDIFEKKLEMVKAIDPEIVKDRFIQQHNVFPQSFSLSTADVIDSTNIKLIDTEFLKHKNMVQLLEKIHQEKEKLNTQKLRTGRNNDKSSNISNKLPSTKSSSTRKMKISSAMFVDCLNDDIVHEVTHIDNEDDDDQDEEGSYDDNNTSDNDDDSQLDGDDISSRSHLRHPNQRKNHNGYNNNNNSNSNINNMSDEKYDKIRYKKEKQKERLHSKYNEIVLKQSRQQLRQKKQDTFNYSIYGPGGTTNISSSSFSSHQHHHHDTMKIDKDNSKSYTNDTNKNHTNTISNSSSSNNKSISKNNITTNTNSNSKGLHPSWAAKQKKENTGLLHINTVNNKAKKIVFDDD